MIRKISIGLAIALTFASASLAGEPPKGLKTFETRGNVGPYAIGFDVTVRDYRQLVTGHYFYASHGVDIPLTGHSDGENLTLQEPGGGTFVLRLTSNDSAIGQDLNFYNSTGLRGTWTQGAKSLPVVLQFETVYDEPSAGRRYRDVTADTDAAYEASVRRFLQAANS